MDILDIMKKRYTTKEYDSSKIVSDEKIEKLEEVLRYGMSSVNSQPWHFFIASGRKKDEIAEATESYNVQKVKDSSHVVVFCAVEYNEEHAKSIVATSPIMKMYEEALIGMKNRPDLEIWVDKQIYLNFGMFIVACQALDIDSTAMEGFIPEKVSNVLNLKEQKMRPVLIATIGYRSPNDPNDPSKSPKTRFPKEKIITVIK